MKKTIAYLALLTLLNSAAFSQEVIENSLTSKIDENFEILVNSLDGGTNDPKICRNSFNEKHDVSSTYVGYGVYGSPATKRFAYGLKTSFISREKIEDKTIIKTSKEMFGYKKTDNPEVVRNFAFLALKPELRTLDEWSKHNVEKEIYTTTYNSDSEVLTDKIEYAKASFLYSYDPITPICTEGMWAYSSISEPASSNYKNLVLEVKFENGFWVNRFHIQDKSKKDSKGRKIYTSRFAYDADNGLINSHVIGEGYEEVLFKTKSLK